jgi:L-fuculose-phosphate aldolase
MTFDRARLAVMAACVELADRGYLAGTGGNVACRIDDKHFAITPSALDYYSMTPDDICVLRLNDLAQIAGDRRPSVESRLHAHVLRARQDCHASIHTHQPIASAYTLLGQNLEIISAAHQSILGKLAICVGYAPSGTGWLASKLRKSLRSDVNAYLLRNHGVVCCGPTLPDTVARVEALESACSNFFRATITNRNIGHCDPYLSEVLKLLVQNQEMESSR